MKFVKYDDLKEFTKYMKLIYGASALRLHYQLLMNLKGNGTINIIIYTIKSWIDNLNELTTFFKVPFDLRKLIYTTILLKI